MIAPCRIVTAPERGKRCRAVQGTFRPHAVDDIHVRGFFVRGGQVHSTAAPFIGQAREADEIQQLPVTGLIALDERTDKIRRRRLLPVRQRHGVLTGGQHDHEAVKGLCAIHVLAAHDVSGVQSLPFLGTWVDAYLESGIFV